MGDTNISKYMYPPVYIGRLWIISYCIFLSDVIDNICAPWGFECNELHIVFAPSKEERKHSRGVQLTLFQITALLNENWGFSLELVIRVLEIVFFNAQLGVTKNELIVQFGSLLNYFSTSELCSFVKNIFIIWVRLGGVRWNVMVWWRYPLRFS